MTYSGSGLDPDISPQAAYIQVDRIAKVRNLPTDKINSLIAGHTEKPFLALFGPEKINVLRLNVALDELH